MQQHCLFLFEALTTRFAITLQEEMFNKKMGPRPENEPEKTDLQIVEHVLKEKLAKKNTRSTFLTSLGMSARSRKSSISSTGMRELEERLEDQEQQSVQAAERYKNEMEAQWKAQRKLFEETIRIHQEKLEAIQQAHENKTIEFEKKQHEMDTLLGYLLRNSQSSQAN